MEFITYNEGDCYIHEKKQLSLRTNDASGKFSCSPELQQLSK